MKKRNRYKIPSVKLGRRIARMDPKDAFAVARFKRGKHTITCGQCPMWKNRYCGVQAARKECDSMACNYGKVLMRAKKQREWRDSR